MFPTIAYLINQYPKVSHSFIRREIAGIESCGVRVLRFSVRSCGTELVDEADLRELDQTQVILAGGVSRLLLSLLSVAIDNPIRFLQAFLLTIKLSRASRRGLARHLAYLAEGCLLRQWLSKAGVDQVHAHFGTNSVDVAMLCHVLGGPPYSFTIHGPEEFDRVKDLALVEKIARAVFVVTISYFGRSQLYRWCQPDQWSKLHLIHCGVDDDFLAQALVPIAADPRLVCVGRLCEDKGQLLLLEAVSRLASEGLQFKLVLVGDGYLRPQIEAEIANLNLQNWVEIIGWASSSEVRQQILAARSLVLPSFAEGLPVVIMEALALGRPVISTYIAGIPELVEPNVCGWLVPPGSVEALVEVMRTALTLPIETLEKMGKVGAERVAKFHSSTIEAHKLTALFQSKVEQSSNKLTPLPLSVSCSPVPATLK